MKTYMNTNIAASQAICIPKTSVKFKHDLVILNKNKDKKFP
jgi:hypothetical protein